MYLTQRGGLLTRWRLPTALDEWISRVAGETGAYRCVTGDATFGICAAVSRAGVDALLSHAGVVAEAVCIDHTLGPTAGRSAKVVR